MSPTRIVAPLLIGVVAAMAGACSGAGDGHRLRGTVRDAVTGAPVSRAEIYLHFFCDEAGFQATLDPEDTPGYETPRLPLPKVRVRAFDRTKRYALFETTLTVPGEGRNFDIALSPSGLVRLFGKVVDAATGAPIRPGAGGGHGPLLYFHAGAGAGAWSEGPVALAPDGSFSVRVPRTLIAVSAVDTAAKPVAPDIDLTGATGDEYAADIALR